MTAAIPDQMTFRKFCHFFEVRLNRVFFTSEKLRIAIGQVQQSQNGKKLTQSYAMITMLEYLTDQQKIKAQLVCKKWQKIIVPMTFFQCPVTFTVKPTTLYRFVYDVPETG